MLNDANAKEIAVLVRAIAEQVSPEIVHPGGVYPDGWCRECSGALRKLLEDRGEHGFLMAFGAVNQHDMPIHVWLTRDAFLIDITADQFDADSVPAVIAANRSPWHEQFHVSVEDPIDIDGIVDGSLEDELYEAIRRHPAWRRLVLGKPTKNVS